MYDGRLVGGVALVCTVREDQGEVLLHPLF